MKTNDLNGRRQHTQQQFNNFVHRTIINRLKTHYSIENLKTHYQIKFLYYGIF